MINEILGAAGLLITVMIASALLMDVLEDICMECRDEEDIYNFDDINAD